MLPADRASPLRGASAVGRSAHRRAHARQPGQGGRPVRRANQRYDVQRAHQHRDDHARPFGRLQARLREVPFRDDARHPRPRPLRILRGNRSRRAHGEAHEPHLEGEGESAHRLRGRLRRTDGRARIEQGVAPERSGELPAHAGDGSERFGRNRVRRSRGRPLHALPLTHRP